MAKNELKFLALNGTGPFAQYGCKIFDDFWINYMTKEMASSGGLVKPLYTNLRTYLAYRNLKNLCQ